MAVYRLGREFSSIKDISSEHIVKIEVYTVPFLFDPVELTGAEEIEIIIQYLNNINPSYYPINTIKAIIEKPTGGMAYVFKILYGDGTERTITLSGNNVSISISNEEASQLVSLMSDIILNTCRTEYSGMILSGEVLSFSSDLDGQIIECEIRAGNGEIYAINLTRARPTIVWMKLNVGNEVEIGVNDDNAADWFCICNYSVHRHRSHFAS